MNLEKNMGSGEAEGSNFFGMYDCKREWEWKSQT